MRNAFGRRTWALVSSPFHFAFPLANHRNGNVEFSFFFVCARSCCSFICSAFRLESIRGFDVVNENALAWIVHSSFALRFGATNVPAHACSFHLFDCLIFDFYSMRQRNRRNKTPLQLSQRAHSTNKRFNAIKEQTQNFGVSLNTNETTKFLNERRFVCPQKHTCASTEIGKWFNSKNRRTIIASFDAIRCFHEISARVQWFANKHISAKREILFEFMMIVWFRGSFHFVNLFLIFHKKEPTKRRPKSRLLIRFSNLKMLYFDILRFVSLITFFFSVFVCVRIGFVYILNFSSTLLYLFSLSFDSVDVDVDVNAKAKLMCQQANESISLRLNYGHN